MGVIAAAAVFQQGRRVGELAERGGNNLSDAAMLQCHSYLSTVETLRLVDPKDAWISVPVDRISDKVSPRFSFRRIHS
jgi:hypothetical protein